MLQSKLTSTKFVNLRNNVDAIVCENLKKVADDINYNDQFLGHLS